MSALKIVGVYALTLLCCALSQAQESSKSELYNWLDNQTGIENTALYNGRAYPHQYRFDGQTHQFLDLEFKKGSVVYDEQPFFGISLKYDIHNDMLLLERFEQIIPIKLIKDKVQSFTIDGRKFVNLRYGNVSVPEFITGYYEIVDGKKSTLYVKHNKNSKQTMKGDRLVDVFTDAASFIVLHQSQYHQIKSKKDLIKIFKESKQTIDDYYRMNSKLEKSDKVKFMISLATLIENSNAQ